MIVEEFSLELQDSAHESGFGMLLVIYEPAVRTVTLHPTHSSKLVAVMPSAADRELLVRKTTAESGYSWVGAYCGRSHAGNHIEVSIYSRPYNWEEIPGRVIREAPDYAAVTGEHHLAVLRDGRARTEEPVDGVYSVDETGYVS